MKTEEINNKLPDSNYDLFFDEAVKSWDEAVPLGNGLSGCLIWGDGNPLRLSLDRGDLWDTRPAPETLREDFNYKKLIELVKLGAEKDILSLFDNFYGRAAPTKIPAGHLEIKYACPAEKEILKSYHTKQRRRAGNLKFPCY